MTVEFFAEAERAGESIHQVLEDGGFVPAMDPENPSGEGLAYVHPENDSWAYVLDGSAYGELEGMRAHEMQDLQENLSAFQRDELYTEDNRWDDEPVENVEIVSRNYMSSGPK